MSMQQGRQLRYGTSGLSLLRACHPAASTVLAVVAIRPVERRARCGRTGGVSLAAWGRALWWRRHQQLRATWAASSAWCGRGGAAAGQQRSIAGECYRGAQVGNFVTPSVASAGGGDPQLQACSCTDVLPGRREGWRRHKEETAGATAGTDAGSGTDVTTTAAAAADVALGEPCRITCVQGCRWLGAVGALSLGWHARGAACAVHSSNAPVLAALLDARMATTGRAYGVRAAPGGTAGAGDPGGLACWGIVWCVGVVLGCTACTPQGATATSHPNPCQLCTHLCPACLWSPRYPRAAATRTR